MKNNTDKTLKVVAWFLFTGYSLCLLYWMFRGFGRSSHAEIRVNLVPFNTIFSYIYNVNRYNIGTTIINLAGNIGVFIPFGVLLPYIFQSFNRYGVFLAWFTGSIIVLEFLQAILKVGIGDIDDIILNVVGASTGFVMYRYFSSKSCSGEQKF
ncbi:VanZ family protein [Paenibacillus sp. KQZ6P-2]|uniref:VanZ family protein n=1 Tax=Paenibacillus mangrovi TaxID=2931978 RepID=A0A9X1WK59_9BACL|nr:VanZ family protein [Paenibacillus mangrovi]MCJ8010822.1 VanZ family protein [Paenibacillus mangrovi]